MRWNRLSTLPQRNNLSFVLKFAAHALLSTHNGEFIGSLNSDVTVFSFYATKTITTSEGGMVVTRNPKLTDRCRTMHLHGIIRDVFNRYTSTKPSWHYGSSRTWFQI